MQESYISNTFKSDRIKSKEDFLNYLEEYNSKLNIIDTPIQERRFYIIASDNILTIIRKFLSVETAPIPIHDAFIGLHGDNTTNYKIISIFLPNLGHIYLIETVRELQSFLIAYNMEQKIVELQS